VLAATCVVFAATGLTALPPDREIKQYVRRSWTIEQGLPHGTVRGFAQTSDGYLWLATYEGLVRFNGEHFRVFDNASAPGIPNSTILTVTRSHDDTLWLGTVAGLVRYRNGEFHAIAREPGIPDEQVIAVEEAFDGTIWVGTWGGLNRVVGDRLQRVRLPMKSVLVNALLPARDGGLWIGLTSEGLVHRSATGAMNTITTSNGLASDTVICLLADGPDALYAGTASGLDHIRGGVVTHISGLPADQVTALRKDRDGSLWIGTYSSGLFRLHGGAVASYGIADGLLNPTVRGIFEDDEGSIWIGSNRGLEQMRTGLFTTWNKNAGLSDDFTRAIFEDRDGILWAGTAHGLSRGENGTWSTVTDSPLSSAYVLSIAQSVDGAHWFGTSKGLYRVFEGKTTFFTTADGLSSNNIRAIFAPRDGGVWLATDSSVTRIHADGRIESYEDRGLGTEYAIGIVTTPDGRIWIATGRGLAEYDGKTFTVHSAPAELPSNRLFALDADEDGTLWIATDGEGLVRYRNGEARVITSKNGLPYDKILSIADDEAGSLWFGTVRGAFKAAKKDLHAIAEGRAVRLSSTMYDESDGLGSRQCNGSGWPAALRTRDGRIWFATANGLSALAKGMTQSAVTPVRRKPVIEQVSIDGKVVSTRILAAIPPGAGRIDLEFNGVTLAAPENLRFRYRLDGYDKDWIDAGANRVASYTNLPAGEYRFVLASSRDGMAWQSATLPVVLRPHFYQRRSFIALLILAGATLLLAIHFMRLRLARQRAHLLQQLVEERTRQISEEKERTEHALREAERHEQLAEEALARAEDANRAKSIFLATTSHELRTPLNAIIGFSDILIGRATHQLDSRFLRFLHNIHSSGGYLLGIINNILDLSKIEAGKMDLQPETIALNETVSGVCAVMKGVTTLRKITLDLRIPNDLPKFEADPIQMKQILYNLIANAVKFSPDSSSVTVSARHLWPADCPINEHAIEIRVVDHGIGIDPRDHQLIFQEFRQVHESGTKRPEGTGLGLALVRRFVEMHGGTIRVESTPGEGATFIIVLPCRQPALAQPPENDTARVDGL